MSFLMSLDKILGIRKKGIRSIAFAVAFFAVILSMSLAFICLFVISGFQQEYQKSILAFNAHIVLLSEQEQGEEKKVSEAIEKINFQTQNGIISDISPFAVSEAVILDSSGIKACILKAIDPQKLKNVYSLELKILDGQADLSRGLLLGSELAYQFPENKIKMIIPKGASLADLKRSIQTIPLAGFFRSGIYEFDSRFALTSFEMLKKLTGVIKITGYEIALQNPLEAPRVAKLLEESLPGMRAISWDELNSSLFKAMQMEKSVFLIVVTLIFFVAAFNLLGATAMSVYLCRYEIALLYSLGVSKLKLQRSFGLTGFLFGITSCVMGWALAFLILKLEDHYGWVKLDPKIYFISTLPMDFSPNLFGMGLIFGGLVCFLFAFGAAKNLIQEKYLINYIK